MIAERRRYEHDERLCLSGSLGRHEPSQMHPQAILRPCLRGGEELQQPVLVMRGAGPTGRAKRQGAPGMPGQQQKEPSERVRDPFAVGCPAGLAELEFDQPCGRTTERVFARCSDEQAFAVAQLEDRRAGVLLPGHHLVHPILHAVDAELKANENELQLQT